MRNETTLAPNSVDPESLFLKSKRQSELDTHCVFSMRNKWLYFPVPKAANSTIKYILSRSELGPNQPPKIRQVLEKKEFVHNHMVGPLLRPYFFRQGSEEILREIYLTGDFFRFSVVRNPFTRVLSCYLDRFLRKGMTYRLLGRQAKKFDFPFKETEPLSFRDFLKVIDLVPTVAELDQHVRPQVDQIHTDLISYDAIGCFETLEADVTKILNKLYGFSEYSELFSKNLSPSVTKSDSKIDEFFDDESEEIVRRVYAKDFKAFGYSTDLPC